MADRVENITDRGARRRRAGGVAWLALGLVAAVFLIALGTPRWSRLLLMIPFSMAANGFLQARERT